MGMEDALANFYEEPEEMKELIDFLTECELDFAKTMIERCHIEAVLHHDDGYARNLIPYMVEMGMDIWCWGSS